MSEGLPAVLASRQRRSVIDDATAGLGTPRGPHVSIRGGKFTLVGADGKEFLVPTHHFDFIAIDANKNDARVYFEGAWDPSMNTPPLCFSDNGTGPSTQAMQPQSTTCAVCPNNVVGSDTSFNGFATTACEKRKKIAIIVPDDPSVTVYEFQIPPGSLKGLKAYAKWLKEQATGVQGRGMDIADVVTRASWDPDKQFVMTFNAVAFADDERTIQLIDYIDQNKLSDAAVGRNDVAHDPAQVAAMLAGRPAPQAIAPPAAQPAPQTPQFSLPPRANTPASSAAPAPAPFQPQPQLAGPPAVEAPQAPKRRGRQAQPPQPSAPGAAAPFMAPAQPTTLPSPGTQFTTSSPAVAVPLPNPPIAGTDNLEVPAFLKREPNNVAPFAQPSPGATPRFGVGAPPAPPPGVASALNAAMSLPTRR